MSRLLVAIADHPWTDEFGTRSDIRAGITRVAPDWSGLKDPAIKKLFAPSDTSAAKQALARYESEQRAMSKSQPARLPSSSPDEPWRLPEPTREASCVLPAGSTITDGEIPELRLDRTPTVTLNLRARVWEDLRSLAGESRDGLETGGFLFGEHYFLSRTEISPRWVTRMVHDCRVTQARLDMEALVAEKRTLRKSGINHVGEIGNWHTHPGNSGVPSDSDLRNWLNAHDFLGRSAYFGLILTADPSDVRWRSPTVHAWVVRRLEHTDTPVCERAKVQH